MISKYKYKIYISAKQGGPQSLCRYIIEDVHLETETRETFAIDRTTALDTNLTAICIAVMETRKMGATRKHRVLIISSDKITIGSLLSAKNQVAKLAYSELNKFKGWDTKWVPGHVMAQKFDNLSEEDAVLKYARKGRRYDNFKAAVSKRDNSTCIACSSTEKIDVHHVIDVTSAPLSAHDPKNGVCLCHECHVDFHINFMGGFNIPCDEADLENWLDATFSYQY